LQLEKPARLEIRQAKAQLELPSPGQLELPSPPKKKLRVGFFSFTGCEGCMIEFLEILNTKFFEWAPLLDVRYCRLLKGKNKLEGIDVSFVEGAISSDKEMGKLKKIRENSKRVVAIGSCAISGAPNNWRNYFDQKTKEEIAFILEKFGHREKVSPISEFVKVDANVPGCPMLDGKFIQVMEDYMREFGVLPPKQEEKKV